MSKFARVHLSGTHISQDTNSHWTLKSLPSVRFHLNKNFSWTLCSLSAYISFQLHQKIRRIAVGDLTAPMVEKGKGKNFITRAALRSKVEDLSWPAALPAI